MLKEWLEKNSISALDFSDTIDNIKDALETLEDYKKNPSIYNKEEIEFLLIDLEQWEEEVAVIKYAFMKENKDADWEMEVSKLEII